MIVGIDFATTNSCLVYSPLDSDEPRHTQPTPLAEAPYDKLLRSSVLVDRKPIPESEPRGVLATGVAAATEQNARRRSETHANDILIDSFKPYLNRYSLRETHTRLESRDGRYSQHQEVTTLRNVVVHEDVNDPYSYDELIWAGGAVLGTLKDAYDRASSYAPIEKLYVGLPFGVYDFMKRRILTAAVRGGLVESHAEALRKVKLVYEPIAIAYSQPMRGREAQNVLVFDFGGGTLDLAILRFTPTSGIQLEVEQVLALGGMHLGGRHFDEALRKHLESPQGPGNPASFKEVYKSLRRFERDEVIQEIERLKIRLSDVDTARLISAHNLEVDLDRASLERALAPHMAAIEGCIHATLARAGLRPDEIHRTILAGGSSLMPCVQATVERALPDSRHIRLDTESTLTCVARGLVRYGQRARAAEATSHSYSVFFSSPRPELKTVVEAQTPFVDGWARGETSIELPGGLRSFTVCVMQRIDDKSEMVYQIANLPTHNHQRLILGCAVHQDIVLPTITLRTPEGVELDVPSPQNLTEEQARELLTSTGAVLRAGGPTSRIAPTKPIENGDRVRHDPAPHAKPGPPFEGKVIARQPRFIDEHSEDTNRWMTHHYSLDLFEAKRTEAITADPFSLEIIESNNDNKEIFEQQLEHVLKTGNFKALLKS